MRHQEVHEHHTAYLRKSSRCLTFRVSWYLGSTNELLPLHCSFRSSSSSLVAFFILLSFRSRDLFRLEHFSIPPPRRHKFEHRNSRRQSSQRANLVPRMQHKRQAGNYDDYTKPRQYADVAIVDEHFVWRLYGFVEESKQGH